MTFDTEHLHIVLFSIMSFCEDKYNGSHTLFVSVHIFHICCLILI